MVIVPWPLFGGYSVMVSVLLTHSTYVNMDVNLIITHKGMSVIEGVFAKAKLVVQRVRDEELTTIFQRLTE